MLDDGLPARSQRAAQAWLWTTVALTAGGFGVALLLAPPLQASPGRALTVLLFVGSSVHVSSTACLFSAAEVRIQAARRKPRYLWAPLGLVGGAALLGGLASAGQRAWFLLALFAWQMWHYQKQNLGITALAASAVQAPTPRRVERASLAVTAGAGIAALMSRPALLQIKPHVGVTDVFTPAAIAFVVGSGLGVAALARRPARQRPVGLCVAYVMALLFPLPIFLFASPYAAVGGMTIAHGLQYLVLVGLVADNRQASRWTRRMTLANVAVLGGLALSVASHLHDSFAAGRAVYGAYTGLVMAHFVIDAGLWRMRDPDTRAVLSARVPFLVHSPRPSALAHASASTTSDDHRVLARLPI